MCCCPSSSVGTPSYGAADEIEPSGPCLAASPFLLDDRDDDAAERSATGSTKDILLWMRKTIVLRPDIESIRNFGHIQDETVAHTSKAAGPKRVRFEHVNIRYYSIVLGNNPACREGVPIELAWEHFAERRVPIDEFDRNHRRHRNDFKLTALQRSYRLTSLGYTRQQVMEAQRAVWLAKRQRQATRARLASFVGRFQDRLQERTEAFYASSAVAVRDHKTRRKISPQPLQPPLSSAFPRACSKPKSALTTS